MQQTLRQKLEILADAGRVLINVEWPIRARRGVLFVNDLLMARRRLG
jgi:hypothetical protein